MVYTRHLKCRALWACRFDGVYPPAGGTGGTKRFDSNYFESDFLLFVRSRLFKNRQGTGGNTSWWTLSNPPARLSRTRSVQSGAGNFLLGACPAFDTKRHTAGNGGFSL